MNSHFRSQVRLSCDGKFTRNRANSNFHPQSAIVILAPIWSTLGETRGDPDFSTPHPAFFHQIQEKTTAQKVPSFPSNYKQSSGGSLVSLRKKEKKRKAHFKKKTEVQILAQFTFLVTWQRKKIMNWQGKKSS